MNDDGPQKATVNADDDTGRAVRIRWIDSGLHLEGWQNGDAIPDDAPEVESVGIWMGRGENVVALASTRGEGAWLNVQLIWRPAITAVVWL